LTALIKVFLEIPMLAWDGIGALRSRGAGLLAGNGGILAAAMLASGHRAGEDASVAG
jgi:hypothetical protein